MLRRGGKQHPPAPLHSPAAEQNKKPILEVLDPTLPRIGLVLEIGSGTGQHVVYFAKALPELSWQPTDPNAELRASISSRISAERLSNVQAPLDLDVYHWPWPVQRADAVLCINMIHVAPWAATEALVTGAGQTIAGGGVLFLYGPYRRFGRHTAPSNAAFDADLRARNPEWGLRDIEEVTRLAEQEGFVLDQVVEMPVNNFSLIFRKPAALDGQA